MLSGHDEELIQLSIPNNAQHNVYYTTYKFGHKIIRTWWHKFSVWYAGVACLGVNDFYLKEFNCWLVDNNLLETPNEDS
jgi:hypothetical protein